MSSLKSVGARDFASPGPASDTARRWVAIALRSASVALARWARRVGRVDDPPPRLSPQLEFYADAGALEGALYVDGRLVGRIDGVRRL